MKNCGLSQAKLWLDPPLTPIPPLSIVYSRQITVHILSKNSETNRLDNVIMIFAKTILFQIKSNGWAHSSRS